MPAPADDRLIGATLGDCHLERVLGRGGMGVVYQGMHQTLELPVAVKVLPLQMASDEVFLQRFYREARHAARLDHPNVVRVLNVGESLGRHFIVMAYVDGPSLRDRLESDGPLEEREAADCMVQALDGLAYAHREGCIHRDIKPDNLMISSHGVVKITDFGLARSVGNERDTRITAVGQVMGTPAYMALEQWDSQQIDQRVDIYALGVTFYQILTGGLPYPGDAPTKILRRLLAGDRVQLLDRRPELSRPLAAIVDRLADPFVETRYQKAEEASRDLQSWLADPYASRPAASAIAETRIATAVPVTPMALPIAGVALGQAAAIGGPRPSGRAMAISGPTTTPEMATPGSSTGSSPGSSTGSSTTRLSGTSLGGYRLERRRIAGEHGEVWAGTHVADGRPVLMKFPPRGTLGALRRAAPRLETLERLTGHPNILTFVEICLEVADPFVVFEAFRGTTLAASVERLMELDVRQRLELVRQTGEAVAYAHTLGIIHGHLGPQVIWVSAENEIKLTDFPCPGSPARVGAPEPETLALALQYPGALTRAGTPAGAGRAGTAIWTAPEGGDGALDVRSDIFSLGLVAVFVLTGRPAGRHITRQLERAGIARYLVDLVDRSTEEFPEDRLQTAHEFLRGLERAATSPSTSVYIRQGATGSHPVVSPGTQIVRVGSETSRLPAAGMRPLATPRAGMPPLGFTIPTRPSETARFSGHKSAIGALIIGPRSLVFSGDVSGLVYAWSAQGGKTRWRAHLGTPITAIAIADDLVIVGTSDGNVRALDRHLGPDQTLAHASASATVLLTVVDSPQMLAGLESGEVRVFDIGTREWTTPRVPLRRHGASVIGAGQLGSTVFTAGADGSVFAYTVTDALVPLAAGTVDTPCIGFTTVGNPLDAFGRLSLLTADGRVLVAESDPGGSDTIAFTSIASLGFPAKALVADRDGLVFVAGDDSAVHVVNPATGALEGKIPGLARPITHLAAGERQALLILAEAEGEQSAWWF